MIIVVRTDLKMEKGKIAAQAGHAAVDCALKAVRHHPHLLDMWKRDGQPKIVLKVNSEEELRTVTSGGLIRSLICDAGRTQVKSGTFTALGIGPGYSTFLLIGPSELIDQFTGHLKLF
ncbi:peptidyl-tRNA hydrolase 2, mitochondrial-like [Octopus sinensis]|uniref:peptidyl-tRNA hydrolase n=1 Tax=Octopus sinensis TaxID=2607531 RepID=A0A6P7TRY4_9MOLL|nr:peptidyl-tRNA hydrolase 2, mitochondrial-like [Octopus sinensis]